MAQRVTGEQGRAEAVDRARRDRTALSADSTTPSRRRELDAMRAFVVIGLVFFHSARVFDAGEFYVKNDPTSEIADTIVGFAVLWGMPLLFVISGIGIWHSLQSRSLRTFAAERVRRLLIPLIFGTLVVVPPQVWFQVRAETGVWPDYLTFIRDFFDVTLDLANFPFIIVASPQTGFFEYGQLWFLVLLFAGSLLLIPFFVVVRRRDLVSRAIDRYGAGRLAAVTVAILATIGATLPMEPWFAGWNRWAYLAFLAYGFVLASDRRIEARMRQAQRWVFAAAVLTWLAAMIAYMVRSEVASVDPFADLDAASVAFRVVFAVSGWLWVTSILNVAAGRRGSRRRAWGGPGAVSPALWRRFAGVADEAVLPVYVLHQTVIVAIAFVIVSWSVALGLKYVALVSASLSVTLILFQLVRRTSWTRFLFGMKAGPRPPERSAPSDAPA